MVRKSLEKLYNDTCNIYEYKKIKDSKTKRTVYDSVLVHENVECRVSFKNISAANQKTGEAEIKQVTILFISPDIVIKENSKIDIMRNGRVTEYQNSGKPAVYRSHQEIILNLYKEQS